ncbi:MAG: winged helix-turn-helix transcriptional regulator [Thermoplasmata archaeon]|nr:winged helix-turn-helix transcriptional regulator [Thermoplasmata archaeon]
MALPKVLRNRTTREVLAAFTVYPEKSEKEIASLLSIPRSTLTATKQRLLKAGLYQKRYLPIYPRLPLEHMAVVYSDFNPAVSAEERIENTKRSVEVFEEIVLSIGETHRGLSVSFSTDYTTLSEIYDIRMKVLAKLNLLEIEQPWQVVFPLRRSMIFRFFNFGPLLSREFPDIFSSDEMRRLDTLFRVDKGVAQTCEEELALNRREREILYGLVKYPNYTLSQLSDVLGYSRPTVAKVRGRLIEEGYVHPYIIPNAPGIGFNILTLYHIRINPKKPLDERWGVLEGALDEGTVFMAAKPFEAIVLGVYRNYSEFNRSKSRLNRYLKSEDLIVKVPDVRNHSLLETIWIKYFVFHEILPKALRISTN